MQQSASLPMLRYTVGCQQCTPVLHFAGWKLCMELCQRTSRALTGA